MNEQEIIKRFEEIEKRLNIIENTKKEEMEIQNNKKENFSGLVGGIKLLIKNGFLNTPKDSKEIQLELKREGYHHEIAPISKMLSINFTKINKTLNRIKEENKYKYVVRK